MSNFIADDSDLMNYIQTHSSDEPEILKDLTKKTYLNVLNPRMLSGHIQGRMLKMFVQMINPSRILELGTYTGYSALCMAEGLSTDAYIDTIEVNDELEDIISEFKSKSNFGHKINVIFGDALEIIPTLIHKYDLVFIDANKRNYVEYYNLIFDKVPSGGYIIADNVLWDGHVLKSYEELKTKDSQTRGIKEFNDLVQKDTRVENVLFPLRDGLMIVRKL